MSSEYEAIVCPRCKTNNVSSWVYSPETSSEEILVVDCNECHERYEEDL